MQNFVNFIKENYSYFVYAFEFIVIVVSSIIAFIQRRRSKNLLSTNEYLIDNNHEIHKENRFYSYLPEWIEQANLLYPYHGDGLRRFHFVYQKALDLFDEDPSQVTRSYVSECIDDILKADKLEKIFRDTQDIEPKKELYEKEKDVEIERSEDLRPDGEENKSAERSACYVSRRN